MKKFVTVPMVVEAIQFDGRHDTGLQIQKAFPDENIGLEYDYGRTRHNLKFFNPTTGRFIVIVESDYVVKGALGELFIYRENLFNAMFAEAK